MARKMKISGVRIRIYFTCSLLVRKFFEEKEKSCLRAILNVIHFRFFFPSFLFSLRKNYKSLPTMNFRADKMDVFQFFPNNSTNVYEITITGQMSKLYFPQNREITFPIILILHGWFPLYYADVRDTNSRSNGIIQTERWKGDRSLTSTI